MGQFLDDGTVPDSETQEVLIERALSNFTSEAIVSDVRNDIMKH